jgi:succinate-semialdehyde dehydrogenase/glutarate-semialdehyde dehydrogenase
MAIAVTNPTTGLVEEAFEPHSAAEVERRIAEAHAAVTLLAETTFAERQAWMNRTADILEAEVDELATMMVREVGKPIAAARGEVLKCAKNMRFYGAHAEGFLADEPLSDPSAVGASRALARWFPLGVVLAVMPWNYPLWQVIRFAAPALMAGNTGLLKHASNVPLSAIFLDTIFERGGFPTGSFRTILVGSAAVEAVIADPKIAAVTITGSEPAGRSVAETAGRNIKKAVLELGGSDAFVVLPSADVPRAAEVAVLARTSNNGQSCIAAKRFIVHADVYDRFRDEFVARMGALVVGDPMLPETEVGPLATEQGRADLAELVDDAINRGASVPVGGVVPDGAGWFYPPTVVADITTEMRLYAEEAFGPVASLYRVANIDEAIALANGTDFGLSSAAWTTDPAEKARLERELEAGAVFINGMTVSYPELPFGGVKNSGYGRELGAAGIREFCNQKTVWEA